MQNSKFNLRKVAKWLVGIIIVIVGFLIIAFTGLTGWFPLSDFEVRGDQLWLNGIINGQSVKQFSTILEENPDVTTLVIENVSGSLNDTANRELAHVLRNKGINTHLASHSVAISGGTDLFIAGNERTMERGAEIIVHSWFDGVKSAHEYPRDAPEHEELRKYVENMLGSDEWYWFGIYAAPFDGGYNMTEAEILEYGLLTQPIRD